MVCEFDSLPRVALLYALGQRWADDPVGSGRGWLDDSDLLVKVWGREHRQHEPNNLHVLVHRVRKDAEAVGFERFFLQKRGGRTRLRVAAVQLAS